MTQLKYMYLSEINYSLTMIAARLIGTISIGKLTKLSVAKMRMHAYTESSQRGPRQSSKSLSLIINASRTYTHSACGISRLRENKTRNANNFRGPPPPPRAQLSPQLISALLACACIRPITSLNETLHSLYVCSVYGKTLGGGPGGVCARERAVAIDGRRL